MDSKLLENNKTKEPNERYRYIKTYDGKTLEVDVKMAMEAMRQAMISYENDRISRDHENLKMAISANEHASRRNHENLNVDVKMAMEAMRQAMISYANERASRAHEPNQSTEV